MSATVVAVHGNGGGAFRFSLLPRALTDPEGRGTVRLHAIDLPGFGGTALPTPTSMATYTDALLQAMTKAEGPTVVLAHGIGGSVAMDALANSPQSADALILHAPVGARLDSRLIPRMMSTKPIRLAAKYAISSKLAQAVGNRYLFTGAPDGFAKSFLAEYRRCESFSPMFDLLTADWFQQMPRLTTPTILLWGENDRVLKPEHVADFQAKAPDARTVIQPDWGHFPMIDVPDEYAQQVARLSLDLLQGRTLDS